MLEVGYNNLWHNALNYKIIHKILVTYSLATVLLHELHTDTTHTLHDTYITCL